MSNYTGKGLRFDFQIIDESRHIFAFLNILKGIFDKGQRGNETLTEQPLVDFVTARNLMNPTKQAI